MSVAFTSAQYTYANDISCAQRIDKRECFELTGDAHTVIKLTLAEPFIYSSVRYSNRNSTLNN